ncbi:IQ motif, EF-hand binding site-containing protein [Cynara cardunculus var. scolymus]|uniref:IQ motif, EF-hand binding site-containing protein n=1 Tax=Cynara cardunculus var. scolymus TaxID=59895 RepID=A0A103Y1A4_CYNCS|nr:IQ motif, EF-hand binding site-containing protein [Cynara cardunculus var. scolymus]
MAAFSTLELMLHEVQNQEHIGHHETMPVLPQRPLSKARIPSKRARRAALSFHSQHFRSEIEEFVDGKSRRDGFAFLDGHGGRVLSKDDVKNKEEKAEKGIIVIQKFVRGENARRDFRKIAKMLIEENVNREFVWKPLRDRETTIVYMQSEVLRSEAALQDKKRENAILELRIQHIDKKWELHKAKMNLKEKSWQDELTSIQMSLVSARERTTDEITDHLPRNPTRQQEIGKMDLTIREILELQENDMETDCGFRLKSRKCQEHEFKKLKCRFKAWQKDFKARLHVRRRVDGFDDDCRTQRVHKRCWVN